MKYIENAIKTVGNENSKLQQLLGEQELGSWETPQMNLMRQGGASNQVLNNLATSMANRVNPARQNQGVLNTLGQAMAKKVSPMGNTVATGSRVQGQLTNNLVNSMATSGVQQRLSNGVNRQVVNSTVNPVLQNLGSAMGNQVRQSNVVPVQTMASNQNRVIGNLANVLDPNARVGAQSVILNNQPNTGGLNQGMKYSTYV